MIRQWYKSSFTILLVVFGLAAVLANQNMSYLTSMINGEHSASYDADVLKLNTSLSQAGWPLKYRLKVESQLSSVPPLVLFSFWRLSVNILCFVAAFIATVGYLRYRKRRRQKSKWYQPQTIDFLLAMTIVAAVLGLLQQTVSVANSQRKLVEQIKHEGGTIATSTNLPKWLARYLPAKRLNHAFERISGVTMHEPDEDLLKQVMQCEQLERLRLSGEDFDLRLLDTIPNKSLLKRLRVSGRYLDEQFLQAVQASPQLYGLNFAHTDISAEGVKSLSNMPRLVDLDVSMTDVKLSELSDPSLLNQLIHLKLPRPIRGNSDSIVIADAPLLERLKIADQDQPSNMTPVSVTLRNLQNLIELELDQLQLFDLEIDNCAKASLTTSEDSSSESPTDLSLYKHPLLRNVMIKGDSSIKVLKLAIN
jgi:hypothetical protein